MTQLSPHFSLAEMTRSNTATRRGLDNTPPALIVARLLRTASLMEQVRTICGNRPITVFSGYRSPVVNAAVGGSKTSSHKDGDAVDFKVSGLSIAETVRLIRASGLKFDQVIDEFNQWVHIGFGPQMRQQVLIARKVAGRTKYTVAA